LATPEAAPAKPQPKPTARKPSRAPRQRGRGRDQDEPARTIFGRRRVRARRVRRTIRHIDPWSVFKIAILFCVCLYGALLLAVSVLWSAAIETGLIGNVESFFVEIGLFDELEFDGEVLFRAVAIGGFVLAVASAAFIVLMTVVFNLISDVMGGIRVSVIEEDVAYNRPGGRDPGGRDPGGRDPGGRDPGAAGSPKPSGPAI
jgi:hypothetical protein